VANDYGDGCGTCEEVLAFTTIYASVIGAMGTGIKDDEVVGLTELLRCISKESKSFPLVWCANTLSGADNVLK
jgi:hypothetical protein